MNRPIGTPPSTRNGRASSSSYISCPRTATIASSLFRIPDQRRNGTFPVRGWIQVGPSDGLPIGKPHQRPPGGHLRPEIADRVNREVDIIGDDDAMPPGDLDRLRKRPDCPARVVTPY